MHFADSLDGPFQQLPVPFNTKNKTTEGTGFVMDNPAPYIFENGTVLVLFRKINWCATSNPPTCSRATRALTEIWLARAPSFRGPYEIIGDEPVTQSIREEDPGIWRDQNGAFHAIFHGPGHAWSADGLQWSLATDIDHPNSTKCHTEGDASGCGGPFQGTIKHADGSVQVLGDEERPKVWVNASSGLPELLFFTSGCSGACKGGVMPKDGHTRGVTVVQKIRTVKSTRDQRREQTERKEESMQGKTAWRLVECEAQPVVAEGKGLEEWDQRVGGAIEQQQRLCAAIACSHEV